MADSVLTDAEIRDELTRLGFDPGPVTASTRGLYIKKLNALKSVGKSVARKGKNKPLSKRPLIGFSSDESDEEETNAKWRKGRSRPPVSAPVNDNGVGSLRRRSTKLTPRNRSIVNSVDEDVPDFPLKSSNLNPPRSSRKSLGSVRSSLLQATASTSQRFKRRSLQVVGRPSMFPTQNNNSNTAGIQEDDFSDSDIDEAKESNKVDSKSETNTPSPTPTRPTSRSSSNICTRTVFRTSQIKDVHGDGDESNTVNALMSRSTPRTSTPVKKANNTTIENPVNHKPNSTVSSSEQLLLLTETKPRTRPLRRRSTKDIGSNHVSETINHVDQRSQSRTSNDTQLESEFQTEENITSTWATKYGHYVSMLLLAFVCLFFVTLAVVYLSMGSNSETPSMPQICNGDGSDPECLTGRDGKHVVEMVALLNKGLGHVAGDFLCASGTGEFASQSNMSLSNVKKYLQTELRKKGNYHYQCELYILEMLTQVIIHPDWGIRVYGKNGHLNAISDAFTEEDVLWLVSVHPIMSLRCRVLQSVCYVFVRLFLIISVIFVVWSCFAFFKYRQTKEEEELGEMYQLVDRIIEFLQTNGDKCQAIPHVRDRLISPSERKERQRVWNRAVRYINSEESRVRVETQRIVGEEFPAWRWLQPQSTMSFTPMTETDMNPGKVKVWQGQAFENLDTAVKSAPGIYTQFLKIRNMFDQSLESNTNNWHVEIEDAILDKVGDSTKIGYAVKILHIAVDKNSREGCVYAKVETSVQASYAYRALQGSWFDGRLVTVKYLKSDRYYYRFPSARNMVTALLPSSSKKQSLATMDFSRPTIEST